MSSLFLLPLWLHWNPRSVMTHLPTMSLLLCVETYLEYNKTVVHVKWWSTKFFHYYRISSPYLMFKHLAFWPTVKIPKGVQTSIHWFNQDCWTINTHNGIMKGIRQGCPLCPLSVCFLGDITTFLFHLSLFITTIT